MRDEHNIEEKIREGLSEKWLMQIATVSEGSPWICTVYFVEDDDLNFYWLSFPSRRHSLEIAGNSKVAATVAVKYDFPVIGIQVEGQASEVQDIQLIKAVMKKYVAKYQVGENFYENFINGTNKHRLYKLTPDRFSLFDEVNLKEFSPVELRLKANQNYSQ